MSSSTPPTPPPGVPPQQPQWPSPPTPPAPRESRGVAFFVAIFLGVLLVASAGLNVLLLLLSVGSLASGGLGDPNGGVYDEAFVAGVRDGAHRVLQVPIRGAIAEGSNPVLGAAGGSVSSVQRALRYAESERVEGVLLYIDSPGGGVTDSDRIYQLIRRFRDRNPKVPVCALFGDMCASGGYYAAVAAEHIISRRTSISGSIGVIMSAFNFAKLAAEIGVEQVAIKSERTPYKDMLSMTRPMEPAERAMLTGIVDELYDQFVDVVAEGRGLARDAVVEVANGGIYTAKQAVEHGLVDDIGDYQTALAWFESRLGHEVTIVERRRRPGLADLLFGMRAPAASSPLERLLTTSTGPRFLYYWQGGR
ncbi:MAG TPA: signal peptide peptidase SppA [bacterium]|nr:signal peptide peptidase SppA [bacterium]